MSTIFKIYNNAVPKFPSSEELGEEDGQKKGRSSTLNRLKEI